MAVVVAAALVGGLAGSVLFTVLGGDGGGRVAGRRATTAPTTAQLDEVAEELVDRLAGVRRRTLHLVYSGALPDGEGRLTIEVWWKGGRARQSLVAEAPGGGRQESATFVLGEGSVFCTRTSAMPWACQRGSSAATASASAGIIDALASSLEGREVTSAAARVGEDGECYALDRDAGDVLCLRADDVPVRFRFSGVEMVLAAAGAEVDDSAFEPPAPVDHGGAAPATPTTAAPQETGR